MKALDRFLRAWRTRLALRELPAAVDAVLDIGCGDGYLLRQIDAPVRDGLDPLLVEIPAQTGLRMRAGHFPRDLRRLGFEGPYDAIFALAVFEHLSADDLREAKEALASLLKPGGRLILTVPHPFVDRILDILMILRLIDGQAVEEHHGFQPKDLLALAGDQVRLVRRSTFQLGLNNLFVFERIAARCN